MLDAAGEVQSLTDSIRLENQEQLQTLTDRTLLQGIQNTGGHEAFSLSGETLTWEAAGRDIVYQGTSDKPLGPITVAESPVVSFRSRWTVSRFPPPRLRSKRARRSLPFPMPARERFRTWPPRRCFCPRKAFPACSWKTPPC